MKLYVNHLGQWAGNQDDAKKLGHPFEVCDVPYDKKGLLEFLNENQVTVGSKSAEEKDPRRIPSQKPAPGKHTIDPIVVTSGNTTSTPLSYIKDGIGVTEIQNVYDNLLTAYMSMDTIMQAVGYCPHQDKLLKKEEE